jgi:hypothetical protein
MSNERRERDDERATAEGRSSSGVREGEDSPREVGTYEDWSVGSIEMPSDDGTVLEVLPTALGLLGAASTDGTGGRRAKR